MTVEGATTSSSLSVAASHGVSLAELQQAAIVQQAALTGMPIG